MIVIAEKKKITKNMSISEIVMKHPECVEVFMRHGMHCIGCAAARFENLDQGCAAHGIDVDEIVADLNKAVHDAGSCKKEQKKE